MPATFSANEIIVITNAEIRSSFTSQTKGKIIWDTDLVEPGDWFVAIPSNFEDPHENSRIALSKGAQGIIINRRERIPKDICDTTVLTVADTKTALLNLVRAWRCKINPKVVGISGSFGRRVTMVLLRELLKSRYNTHLAFMSNLGWYGCLGEVLMMPAETDLLIFEAGAIERGDVTRIGGTLDPDLAIITPIKNPLPSRDSFGSALYCELLETLKENSGKEISAVVYDDNPAVRTRLDFVFSDLNMKRFSLAEKNLEEKLSNESIEELSEAMRSAIDQSCTRSEIWCAIEGAKALGITEATLEEIFEINQQAETA